MAPEPAHGERNAGPDSRVQQPPRSVLRDRSERATEATLGIALTILGGYLISQDVLGNRPDDWAMTFYGLPISLIGLVGLFRSAFLTTRKVAAPEAVEKEKQRQATEASRREALKSQPTPWYARYPAALAILGGLWWHLSSRPDPGSDWQDLVVSLAAVGGAIALTWEVSKWLLGLAGLYAASLWLEGQLDSMSNARAILFGAGLIAAAILAARRD
jgi:hypothetical protein